MQYTIIKKNFNIFPSLKKQLGDADQDQLSIVKSI